MEIVCDVSLAWRAYLVPENPQFVVVCHSSSHTPPCGGTKQLDRLLVLVLSHQVSHPGQDLLLQRPSNVMGFSVVSGMGEVVLLMDQS